MKLCATLANVDNISYNLSMTEIELIEKNSYTERLHPNSRHVVIVAHGGSEGKDSSLITKVAEMFYDLGVSVVTFNFSYLNKGIEKSEGLVQELEDLWGIYNNVFKKYPDKEVHLVGKSLGGIVASWLPDRKNATIISISLLGYVICSECVDFGSYHGPVFVIQGEHDRFGNRQAVLSDMQNFQGYLEVVEIPEADHSYRAVNQDGVNFETEVVDKLRWLIQENKTFSG